MKSLISTVVATLLVAVAAVYGVAHRDELRSAAANVPQLAALLGLSPNTGSNDEASSQTSADAENGGAADTGERSPYDVTLAANDQGHFETEAELNGRSVDVMVDTGATIVAMTYEDAERAGIYLKPSDFTHKVSTANGEAKVAPVTISSVSIGSITVRNVEGAVAESGKLHKTLLGMSFLNRLSRVEMRSKNLVLQE
jgi:aspartyl protease family protein